MSVEGEYGCHRRWMYFVERECLLWEANVCRERQVCAVESGYVLWKTSLFVGGKYVP